MQFGMTGARPFQYAACCASQHHAPKALAGKLPLPRMQFGGYVATHFLVDELLVVNYFIAY